MVIFFTEEDMVSFGYYMMSKERRQSYIDNPNFDSSTIEDRLQQVNDADIANWAYLVNQKNNG